MYFATNKKVYARLVTYHVTNSMSAMHTFSMRNENDENEDVFFSNGALGHFDTSVVRRGCVFTFGADQTYMILCMHNTQYNTCYL